MPIHHTRRVTFAATHRHRRPEWSVAEHERVRQGAPGALGAAATLTLVTVAEDSRMIVTYNTEH